MANISHLGVIEVLRRPNAASPGAITAIRRRTARKVWTVEKRRVARGGKPRKHLTRLGEIHWITIRAPAVLDIFGVKSSRITTEFCNEIRRHSWREGVGLILDFRSITHIKPTGAVFLLASIDRLYAGQRENSIIIRRPRSSIVHAVMCQIGIYQNERGPLPEADREDVRHWRSATGVASEGEKGGSMLAEYEGRLADGLTSDLYAGIVEAMTNTVHHAYPPGDKLGRNIGRRWWALSQERDGQLTLAICDLGIGIPVSLPRSATFSSALVRATWIALGLDQSDASAIKVAVELGRTSTGVSGRGRGLSEIIDAANLSDGGRVFISSNRGVFVSEGGRSNAQNRDHSIRGTLIHWTVQISDRGQ